jgi:hypothetical protein
MNPTSRARKFVKRDLLRAVAIAAAVHHHHVTRGRRVATAPVAGPSPWLQAARLEQTNRVPTRG